MTFNLDKAKRFVDSVDLAGTPRGILSQEAAAEVGEVFDKAKTQAQVVGSGLFSFSQGVTAEVREAISDSALLAQLVANKKVSAEEDPISWFKTYGEVLQNVGWTVQEGTWTDYTTTGVAAEVHEKILEVMTAALGPAPAALAIITAAMNALKGMKPDSSWLTIFSRESQKAKIARFQVGLVEKSTNDDVFVSLLACLIEARSVITQVLFFKFKTAEARFKVNGNRVSVNRAALGDLGPMIRNKVRAYQADYMSKVLDI